MDCSIFNNLDPHCTKCGGLIIVGVDKGYITCFGETIEHIKCGPIQPPP